jgi:hypothetical protein
MALCFECRARGPERLKAVVGREAKLETQKKPR